MPAAREVLFPVEFQKSIFKVPFVEIYAFTIQPFVNEDRPLTTTVAPTLAPDIEDEVLYGVP